MADETLRVSLTCIGLCVPSKPVGLCAIMMRQTNPCGIYCLPLTKENSDIVSPLYEHDLTLVACDAMGLEDEHQVLCNFSGETCFRITERRGFRYRLDKQYKHKELAKKLREFIGHTLFVASDFHHQEGDGDAALFKPFFQNNKAVYGPGKFAFFNCVNEAERTTLNGYLLLLTVLQEKKQRGRKPLYTLYWEECANEHATLLDTAMVNLIQFAPHDKLYQQREILALFQGWKAYKRIGLYVTYQALGMDVSYTLYRLFANHTSIINPALLPLNARIDAYNFCMFICKILKEEEGQKPLTPFMIKDVPHSLLVDHIKGGLYDLFKLCITHCRMDARICSAFELLRQHILLPCLIRSLESLATTRSSYNKATLDAITLHSVYLSYHSLTSNAPPLTWPKDESLFEIEVQEEEEETEGGMLTSLAHSLTDFNAVLKILYRAIKERPQECISTETHRWQLKEAENPVLVAKSTTILFYIGADIASLVIEENNYRIHDLCILGKAIPTQIYHYNTTPLEPNTWQESFESRKESVDDIAELTSEFQFILFTPEEIKRNVDLACLKGLLFEDPFNSVILRESGDWHFHRRISEYFATEQDSLDMGLFHRERCFATAGYATIPNMAHKETVFIPQAHMISLIGMKRILVWFLAKNFAGKRIVFLGSPDLLPGHAHGQAFLDLLRAVSLQSTNQAIYNYDRVANNFATLIDEHWRYLVLVKDGCNSDEVAHLLSQETLFEQQDAMSLLYHFKRLSLFAYTISSRLIVKAKNRIRLYALYKRPFNHSQQRIINPLHRVLTTQFNGTKNAHIEVISLEIDALTSYNAMTPCVAYFVISRRSLFSLDKNQVALLFTIVNSLYVIDQVDGEFEDKQQKKGTNLLDLLVTQFRESRRPNVRYSYTCLTK